MALIFGEALSSRHPMAEKGKPRREIPSSVVLLLVD